MVRPRSSARSGRRAAILVVLVVALGVTPALAQGGGGTPTTTTTQPPLPPSTPVPTVPSSTTVVGDPTSTTSTTVEGPEVDPGAPAPEDLAEIGALLRQYDEAVSGHAEVLAAYELTVDQFRELNARIAELDPLIAETQLQLLEAEAELQEAERQARIADVQLTGAELELADAREVLEAQAVEAFVRGGEEGLAVAILAADVDEAGTARIYADAVLDHQDDAVQDFADLRDTAEVLRDEADGARDRAESARDDVEEREAVLREQSDEFFAAQIETFGLGVEQQALAAELERQQVEYQLRISVLEGTSDSISAILAERQIGQELPAATSGIFAWPLPGPVTSEFGPRVHPIFGSVRQHNGLDIDGELGDPALAGADGVVVLAENRGGYGNTVVIEHGNGLATLNGHLTAWAVRPGDRVERGQLIGWVGSTGFSTGPHLHWEVRVYGVPVDPRPFLEER